MAEKGEKDMKNKIKDRILRLTLGVGVAAAVGMTGCGKTDTSSDSAQTAKTEDAKEAADTQEASKTSDDTQKRIPKKRQDGNGLCKKRCQRQSERSPYRQS